MKDEKILSAINLLAFCFLMYASYLFRTNQSAFNKDLNPVFNPAPYTFGIWMLIYTALLIWIIKGFFAKHKIKDMYIEVSLYFALCMVLNGVAVLVPTTLSMIIIIGALASAVIVYDIVDNSNIATRYRVPFSLLTGWLSVATIVNISKFLRNMGFTSIFWIDEIGWTNILLVLGAVLAILFTITRNDILYPLTFVWGYIGILVQNKDIKWILYTSIAMIIVIVGGIIYGKIRRRNHIYR